MPKTLLLADASVTMRKVVEMSFASEDIVVITADSGDEAIAKARDGRPDVLLVNVGIPGKDGYEVCEAVKGDAQLSRIPVLLLTGTFEPFDEERAQRVRADGRIMKPFESQVLVDQINGVLGRHASTASTVPPGPEEIPGPSEAASDAAEDAFDFFDDEPSEFASATQDAVSIEAASDLGDELEPLEIEPMPAEAETAPQSAAFAAATPLAPTAPAAAEATVAVSMSEEPTAADIGIEVHAEEVAGASNRPPAAPAPTESLEEPPLSVAADLPGTSGSAHELESTRLLGEEQDLASPLRGTPPMDQAAADDSFQFDFSSPPLETASPPDLSDELDRPAADDPLAALEPEELVGEAVLDPEGARAHEVSSSDLGEPLAAAPPPGPAPAVAPEATPPSEPERLQASSPEIVSAPPPREAESAKPLPPDLSQHIHESLEKLAWEAFGDVSERLVREALERVEAIAWEVIPQLAETLIREEIRRLKGEGES
jgi:DNA-binding response OmpR family regulator